MGKTIYEYDILFDTDYAWGDADYDDDGIPDNTGIQRIQKLRLVRFRVDVKEKAGKFAHIWRVGEDTILIQIQK